MHGQFHRLVAVAGNDHSLPRLQLGDIEGLAALDGGGLRLGRAVRRDIHGQRPRLEVLDVQRHRTTEKGLLERCRDRHLLSLLSQGLNRGRSTFRFLQPRL